MTGSIAWLVIATAFFVGIHPAISGSPIRAGIVRVVGEAAFQAFFALLSIGGLAWMVLAFEAAPYEPVWVIPELAWVPVIVMPFAALLVVLGITGPNPTSAGQTRVMERDEPATGIIRVTRHPFLVGVVLWAAGHIVANGEIASLIFFGGFALLGIIGPFNIDAKLRRRDPTSWSRLAEATSIVPFAAILQGRNRFVLAEMNWWRIALGIAAYVLLWMIHEDFVGVPIVLGG